jgi:RNA polymerase-binding transcription factor DksA
VEDYAVLTPEQLDHFRARLEQRRDTLQAEIDDVERQIAEPNTIADTLTDYDRDGTVVFARELALNERARLHQMLAHVKRAIERLDAGTYGYSKVSDQPIPFERLDVLPYTTTLVGEHATE